MRQCGEIHSNKNGGRRQQHMEQEIYDTISLGLDSNNMF